MADGEQTGTLNNAKKGAAAAAADVECPVCDKAGLPLLLTRPGIVDKADAATGAAASLVEGATNSVPLPSGEQGYGVRTLRQGYVMVYYQTPTCGRAKAQNGWEAYRVDKQGHLKPKIIPQSENAECSDTKGDDEDFSCNRTSSYASVMMLVIPQPKTAGKVWIAFSDHLWSQPVRDHYAKKPGDRMVEVSISGNNVTCENSAPLNADFVGQRILDYAQDPSKPATEPAEHLYPIAEKRPEIPEGLEQQAQWIISQPDGDGFDPSAAAVVALPDPVGLTAEAAYRRTVLPHAAKDFLIEQGEQELRKSKQKSSDEDDSELQVFCHSEQECLKRGQWLLQSAQSIQSVLDLIKSGKTKRLSAIDSFYTNEDDSKDPALWQPDDPNLKPKVMSKSEFIQAKNRGDLPESAYYRERLGWSMADYYDIPPEEHRRAWEQGVGLVFPGGKSPREVKEDATDLTAAIKGNLIAGSGSENSGNGNSQAGTQDQSTGNNKKASNLAYSQFLDDYSEKEDHDKKLLAKLDKDYAAWLNSDLRRLVTEHDYNPKVPIDGVAYAHAVAAMTLNGPQAPASEAAFTKLFTKDPGKKDNLLMRAALGNYSDYFQWMVEAEKGNAPYDNCKTIFSLNEIDIGATKAVTQADLTGVEPAVEQIMANINATIGVLYNEATQTQKNKQNGNSQANDTQHTNKNSSPSMAQIKRLRYKAVVLTSAVMATSCEDPPTLFMVSMPMSQVARFWYARQGQLTTINRGHNDHQTRLTLSGAIDPAFFIPPEMDDHIVEMPIWTYKSPAELDDSDEGDFPFGPFLSAGVIAAEGAEELSASRGRLAQLFSDNVRLVRSLGATFAGLGAIVNIYALYRVWENLDEMGEEARQRAYVTLSAAAISMVGASLDVYITLRKVAGKALPAGSLTGLVAGVVSAIAVGIMAFQTFMAAQANAATSDEDAAKWQNIQGRVLTASTIFLSAGAIVGYALPGLAFYGISASLMLTGVGIALLIAAAIIGLVVLWLEDGPLAEWASKTIWGTADPGAHFNSVEREVGELHELLIGVRIQLDVDIPYNEHNNQLASQATQVLRTESSGMLGYTTRDSDQAQKTFRESNLIFKTTLQLSFPQDDTLPWVYNIVGRNQDGNDVVLARHNHNVPIKAEAPAVVGGAHITSEFSHEDNTITQHVTYFRKQFSKVWATVFIYKTGENGQSTPQPLLKEILKAGNPYGQ